MILDVSNVRNIGDAERDMLMELLEIYEHHKSKNAQKEKYYDGKISIRDVNLGIALPDGMSGLEIGCAWGAKTVDVLAARSMFDGFVGVDGTEVADLHRLCEDNRLIAQYMVAARDELKFGCTFATLTADQDIGCKIRFHSPMTAAAKWDGDKGRVAYGFAVIQNAPDEDRKEWKPSLLYLYTDDAVWVLSRVDSDWWDAKEYRHKMGRPLIEPLVWNATSGKPFGRSRIKEPIRRLIDGYVRTIANATIGIEFSTAPQKYLLGVTDEQFEAVIDNKFKQYVGSLMVSTSNPETGEKPSFGQLAQGNIQPHVEMIRILATQYSAATGLSVTDTGVVNDANPSSSDAILAQTQTLVGMAEQLNAGNGDALKTIAMMAMAITQGKSMSELTDAEKNIMAHFKNPAMPSVAVTADAAIKIASVRPAFAQTDVFAEMIGFDQAEIRRIKNQEQLARGLAILEGMAAE